MTPFTVVAMPKASVNENYFIAREKNKVWLARKIFSMKLKTVSEAVKQ
jgi:hypothetical protein